MQREGKAAIGEDAILRAAARLSEWAYEGGGGENACAGAGGRLACELVRSNGGALYQVSGRHSGGNGGHAVTDLIAVNKFFPTIAEVRAACNRRRKDKPPD